ncbi:SRP9/SRP14 subunit of signal recognition particle [Chloropicon primus]|uniref:Signal recognition particle 9 kDa protein n=1 Tax=Chloropicon primus TaxID=1764295 RepID=A0A5B8MDL0_9CHLO|nr:SRP9/SRP14 subunit of signal recognition particle [Chloropicon primus]UPQ97455.1 SRP9/SRP14 subunit of signal recognition particle [Chloropicon primus]|eukprot:QDZ18244.1 SRP9/SRP14 subunit of signal recognition particle [Chloropicon primus]
MLLEWDEFAAKAEEMARRNPLHTRYVVKYKHAEGKMTLKATDNEECFTYKTNQASDLKKMEKLNRIMSAVMARGGDVDLDALEDQQAQGKGKGKR